MSTQPSLQGPHAVQSKGSPRACVFTPARIDACVGAFSAGAFDRAAAVLGRMCESATPAEACERGLAQVARGLGERWEADTCDFATLTLAMNRLHALLRRVAERWTPEAPDRPPRRALLAAAPGSQHSFGAAMLAEAFRAAGWEVCAPSAATSRDLVSRVRSGGYDVVGLSLACDEGLEALGRLVGELRGASRSSQPAVFVGGRPFVMRPELARSVGADGTAVDCAGALAMADLLTRRLQAAA